MPTSRWCYECGYSHEDLEVCPKEISLKNIYLEWKKSCKRRNSKKATTATKTIKSLTKKLNIIKKEMIALRKQTEINAKEKNIVQKNKSKNIDEYFKNLDRISSESFNSWLDPNVFIYYIEEQKCHI